MFYGKQSSSKIVLMKYNEHVEIVSCMIKTYVQ